MTYDDLVAFQAYVSENLPVFIALAFFGMTTSQFVMPDGNNKGEHIIQVGAVDGEIVGPWKELSVDDGNKSTSLKPVKLRTVRGQFHEKFIPEELENNYLGELRKRGQDVDDFPLYQYMMELLAGRIAQNNEKAMWKAVETATPTKLSEMFDGYLKQITDAISDSALTPVVLGNLWVPENSQDTAPTGSVDIYDAFEQLVDTLPEEVQQEGVYIFCSAKNKRNWERANKRKFGLTATDLQRDELDRTSMTGEMKVIGCPGLNGSNRIIATPMRNIYFSYDDPEDSNTFNVQKILNVFHVFGSYRIGANFAVVNNDWMAINELA